VDDFISVGSWQATLGVMARCVINLVKHDMCSNSSTLALEIVSTVLSDFSETNVHALYSDEMLSSLYYITGWHITACLKAGTIRAGKKMMVNSGST